MTHDQLYKIIETIVLALLTCCAVALGMTSCKAWRTNDVFGRLRGAVDLYIDLTLGSQVPDLRHLQSYLFYFNHL